MVFFISFRAILYCCFLLSGVHGSFDKCITWPEYVTPNDTRPCTCVYDGEMQMMDYLRWATPDGSTVVDGPLMWPALALPLENISRTSSGRPFTCYLETWTSTYSLGTYSPYLAYGPDDVTIVTSQTFVPEDGSDMTLTCLAKVNPQPRFQWEGQPPDSVTLPGCYRGNETFSETLIFNPGGLKDGDVISCNVTNSVENWPQSGSTQFTLRFGPSKPQTISFIEFLAVVVTLSAMLVTSLILLFLQWRRNRNHVCKRNDEETERKQRMGKDKEEGDRDSERDREQEPLLTSQSTSSSDHAYCSVGDTTTAIITHVENPSVQAYDED